MESKRNNQQDASRPSRRFPGKIADAQTSVQKAEAEASLNKFAKLDASTLSEMGMPAQLFMSGGPKLPISFSANSTIDPGSVARWLLGNSPKPSMFPDYGIHISSHGSHVFCTLIDRSRKIIVSEPISSDYSEAGSWGNFSLSLKDALSRASELIKKGTAFEFVVAKDSAIDMI